MVKVVVYSVQVPRVGNLVKSGSDFLKKKWKLLVAGVFSIEAHLRKMSYLLILSVVYW